MKNIIKLILILSILLVSCNQKKKEYFSKENVEVSNENYRKIKIVTISLPEYKQAFAKIITQNKLCEDRIWGATYKENDSIKYFHVGQDLITDVNVIAKYNDFQLLLTFINHSPILIDIMSKNINKEIFKPTGHYIYWLKDTINSIGIDDTSPEWIIYNGQIKKIRNGICE